jgi:hypothetical protein
MVDKSISPFQTHFGPVVCHEAVQTSLLFPERGSIGVLLLADSPISPQHGAALTSGFGASQAETGGKGQESTMAIWCEGVFKRYKGVLRLEVNVLRQAWHRNV